MTRHDARRLTHLLLLTLCLGTSTPALAATTHQVSTAQELRDAVAQANPGDSIVLADGTYRLDGKLRIDRPGTQSEPIRIEAANLHQALIEVNTVEGISWSAAHWHMEGLRFKGVCANPGDCEHALHIVADADGIVIRHNVFEDFNAQIKGNGVKQDDGSFLMPDDVLIEANEFFDNTIRPTGAPVTKIDIVGGNRWTIWGNFIHDFAKGGGNNISYAAFLKGKSTDGIFERNLVVCEALHTGHVRLGLSFGGGGTGDQFCPGNTCTPEHSNGIMRNNIIAKCPKDVGIYLNESANTLIEHNTLYDNSGIDVRFESSSATLRHNLMTGRIRERNGGTITASEGNLDQLSNQDFAAFFLDPANLDFTLVNGAMFVDKALGMTTTDDFCGQLREPGAMDIGAVEYLTDTPCDTSTLPPSDTGNSTGEQDMGGGSDMGGTPEQDMAGMPDMGGMTGGGDDMNAGPSEDMTPDTPDMTSSGSADQGASSPGGSDMAQGGSTTDTPDEDEGCSVTHPHRDSSPTTPLLLLTALIGLLTTRSARRRKPLDTKK